MNARQELFVVEYVKDLNATQAAVRAGYSKNGASAQGHRLLQNAEVRAAIAQLQGEIIEQSKVDARFVYTQLAELASVDRRDFHTEEGGLKPMKDLTEAQARLLVGVDVTSGYGGSKYAVTTKVKLLSPIAVLDLLGKHQDVAAWKEGEGRELTVEVRDYRGRALGVASTEPRAS